MTSKNQALLQALLGSLEGLDELLRILNIRAVLTDLLVNSSQSATTESGLTNGKVKIVEGRLSSLLDIGSHSLVDIGTSSIKGDDKSARSLCHRRMIQTHTLTTSFSTLAAMEQESLPPSTATPSTSNSTASHIPISFIKLLIASQQEYMEAASPGSLAAHIQLPLHLTLSSPSMRAQTRLVTASPTERRPMAAGLMRPLMGCSPMEEAIPVVEKWDWARTATSEMGVWRGPQH